LVAAGVAARDSDYSQLAVGAATVGAKLLNQSYSRDAELESDFYGIQYMARAGYDPRAAIHLQETFVRLSKSQRSGGLAGLFASHPPSQERVDKNRKSVSKLAAGGVLGRTEYQKMISRLKKNKPAYNFYDTGRRLLAQNKSQQALVQARKAIKIEPREALFYGLQGDALQQQRKSRKALKAYNAALKRNDGFFGYYLGRGKVRQSRGDTSGARQDFLRSIELLPTATAHYLLGQQYAATGNPKQAVSHFQQAAGSPSKEGIAAGKALVKLDLPNNPHRYIHSRLSVDNRGFVLIHLENRTPMSVGGIRVAIGQKTPQGRLHSRKEVRFRQHLGAGEKVTINSRYRLPEPQQTPQLGSRVIAGRVVK